MPGTLHAELPAAGHPEIAAGKTRDTNLVSRFESKIL